MKKLLIALLLVSPIVHAEKYFELRNKAGGKIVLHAVECYDKSKPSLKLVTATAPSQKTIFGCWGYIGGEVHVVYDDGERRSYPADVFTFIDTDSQ